MTTEQQVRELAYFIRGQMEYERSDKLKEMYGIDKYVLDHLNAECDKNTVPCCGTVDIIAKLQQELNESQEMVKSKGMVINVLDDTRVELKNTIDDLESQISLFVDNAAWYRHVITEREKTIELKQETIKDLEDELSVRKRDSKVLMDVVGVITAKSIPLNEIPYRIMLLVDDYITEPPEEEELTIFIDEIRNVCKQALKRSLDPLVDEPEEENCIIVEVNSAEDVAPIVEKIAESVAARIKCPVRVQFVTDEDSNDR